MMGVYLCQVQSTSNSSVIVNRTLTIHIHGIYRAIIVVCISHTTTINMFIFGINCDS